MLSPPSRSTSLSWLWLWIVQLTCRTLPLWAGYDKLTHDYFFSKTLQDLL